MPERFKGLGLRARPKTQNPEAQKIPEIVKGQRANDKPVQNPPKTQDMNPIQNPEPKGL